MSIDKKLPKPVKGELPVLTFITPAEWRDWLEHERATSKGIWMRFYKKNSGVESLHYAEALDEALCYGWVDGQLKVYDEKSYLQKFTPRRERSIWSKRNIENVKRLKKDGRMKPSGLKEADAAKVDGRWDKAYDSPANMTIPEDFLSELSKDKKAVAFFETLNKVNKYAIAWRLQTAKKPETREKRMISILKMLSRGEKFH